MRNTGIRSQHIMPHDAPHVNNPFAQANHPFSTKQSPARLQEKQAEMLRDPNVARAILQTLEGSAHLSPSQSAACCRFASKLDTSTRLTSICLPLGRTRGSTACSRWSFSWNPSSLQTSACCVFLLNTSQLSKANKLFI